MKYTLHVTVNRSNGTDYDFVREYIGSEALARGMEAAVAMARRECLAETGLGPSSVILTVVPFGAEP